MLSASTKVSAAVGAAALVVAINCGLIAAGRVLPGALAIVDGVVGLAALIFVCLVALPWVYRVAAIVAIVVSFLAVIARSDMFTVAATTATIDDLAAPAKQAGPATALGGGSSSLSTRDSAQGGTHGAAVQLVPRGRDGGWAERLNARLDRQIGGDAAQAVTIRGYVTAQAGEVSQSVTVTWSVMLAGKTVPCGGSSVVGSDEPLLAAQIAQTIEAAINRTSETRQPTCF